MIDDVSLACLARGPEREAYLPLLLMADVEQQLRAYLQEGNLYVISNRQGQVLGVTLTIPAAHDPSTVELRAVAVDAAHHHQGVGKRMLAGVLADLRESGWHRAIVGTSNASIGQIAFYQKAGFRVLKIERDFFTAERGYDPDDRENGLPHRDMIWFDRELAG